MKRVNTKFAVLAASLILIVFSCKKDISSGTYENATVSGMPNKAQSNYNLEVVLHGEGSAVGHIHFRQDRDPAKIINLDTKVQNLMPNHTYKLQRAVDAINNVDGNCTSTTWLTLGYGLIAHMITTDENGQAEDVLWRNVSMIPSGSRFDIHFQVIDATSGHVILTSDCYQYTVR